MTPPRHTKIVRGHATRLLTELDRIATKAGGDLPMGNPTAREQLILAASDFLVAYCPDRGKGLTEWPDAV